VISTHSSCSGSGETVAVVSDELEPSAPQPTSSVIRNRAAIVQPAERREERFEFAVRWDIADSFLRWFEKSFS
jgi:hypothetical protein